MNRKIWSSLLAAGIGLSAWGAVRVTPVNPAEAVFAPFWDMDLREIQQWKVNAGSVRNEWCNVSYRWDRKKIQPGNPAFEMTRSEVFSCEGYDTLLFSGRTPQQSKIRVELETDLGKRTGEWIAVRPVRDEYAMKLDGAKTIRRITFQVFDTGKNQETEGSLLWMGLQNGKGLKELLEQRKRFAAQPLDVFFRPGRPDVKFSGRVNLLAPAEQLEAVQIAYQQRKLKLEKDFIFENNLDEYEPEKLLADTLPFANPHLFGRIRDDGRNFRDIRGLFSKALITKNRQMLEKALRAALVIALTPNWDCSFLSDFPDSGWDQRVFSQAYAAEIVALALDCGDELLSQAGKNLLLKRLAQDGLGSINYNVWRYTYLFGNNQLSVFTRGRIAAYLTLEKAYAWNGPRVKPYTEMAMSELFASVEKLVYPDGSFMEGPGYFFYTVSSIQPVLEMYAGARGKPLRSIVPECMKNLGRFGDAFISTDRRGGVIPVSSSQSEGRHAAIPTYQFLALLSPDSQWVTLYHDRMRKWSGNEFWIPDVAAMAHHAQVAPGPVKVKPLTVLPQMGVAASTRFIGDVPVKLLLVGTKANCRSHRHNDRGSFVLEFAGDTFAADPGGQSYADAAGHMVKRSDYHNMLVPGIMPDNEELMVASADVCPKAEGNEKSFHAEINPAPSSRPYFTEWKRVIDSPVPDHFVFRDEYKLTPEHSSARFLWITELPWKQLESGVIRIDGQNAYALIRYPKDMKFQADVLTIRRTEKFNRLSIEKNAASGVIEMEIRLFRK